MSIKTVHDLKIYKESFRLAMKIFSLAKNLPDEEKYSLRSQIIRSSRSVSANIREGYAKRFYSKLFIRHLVDSLGSAEETRTWLEFSIECNYINGGQFQDLDRAYDSLGGMIYNTIKNWKPIENKDNEANDSEEPYDYPDF